MAQDDDIAAWAAGKEAPEDDSDIAAIAQGADPAKGTEAARGVAGSFLGRTVGRLPGALDRALGGLPSTAAGVAGAYSADDEQGVIQALKEGGGVGRRLLNVLLGTAELGLTSKFPGSAAASGAVGAGVEGVTGSEKAGDVAEIGTGMAHSAGTLAKGAYGAAKSAFGGPSVERMVTEGLDAGTTAQQAGRNLQGPVEVPGPVRPHELQPEVPGQAQQAITRTSEEARGFYKEAQAEAKAGGLKADRKGMVKAARGVLREYKKTGQRPPGIVRTIMGAARGTKASALLQQLKKASPTGEVPIDELIDLQSTLRNRIRKMPADAVERRSLIDLSKAMDDTMAEATKGTNVGENLARGRRTYRDKTIPTRKTGERTLRAETPEQATRYVTSAKQPTRFERITSAAPESAEPMRSAGFNDMVQGSMKGGKLDLQGLSSKLDAAEASGQLKNLANTPARMRTIKAIRRVSGAQSAAEKAPIAGGGAGAVSGIGGIAAGWLTGRVIQVALKSEKASRALLRLAIAKQGSSGWKLAKKVLDKAVAAAGPGARAAVSVGAKDEEE